MTKANYLWDPDGNGIEIYVETPEDGTMGFANGTFFAQDKDGRTRSGRDPIDLEELFSHLRDDDSLDEPMPAGTKMGHVHLHVSDVEDALRFYHDLVGFDVMGHVPGVGFVSAGGYHHHVGLNTWAGQGAPPAPPGSAGLRRYTIELPTQRDLDDVIGRLEHGNIRLAEEDGGLAAADPSANRVLFRVVDEKSVAASRRWDTTSARGVATPCQPAGIQQLAELAGSRLGGRVLKHLLPGLRDRWKFPA